MLLLAWGTVDQIRYYLTLHDDNLADLQRAARLTAYDSSLEMRLAKQALDHGQKEQAVAALQRAMAADPSSPTARNLYLQYLTSERHYDEAYALTQAAIAQHSRDAQLFLNDGTLALELGKPAAASSSWTKAIALDPHLADAHLYLAAELDSEGKSEEALPHYKRYLDIVSRQGADHRPPPEQVIGAALKLADGQQRAHQSDSALKTYDLARKLAAQTKQAKLESLSSMNEADLQFHAGNTHEALQLYQRAIFLDDSLHDSASEATDLEQYAVFLHATGSPARLAYAALLRAQLLRGASAPASPEIRRLRSDLEHILGPQAASLRHDSVPALSEALSAPQPNALPAR
jgi:tetratricopeptide (TPR) repeat protein